MKAVIDGTCMLSFDEVRTSDADSSTTVPPGEKVRRERVRLGLTQEELASMIGRHRNTIRNLESGRGRAPRKTVEAVAEALGTTPTKLGFYFRTSLRSQKLTAEQTDVVERILALPPAQLERVRAALRAAEAIQNKGRKR